MIGHFRFLSARQCKSPSCPQHLKLLGQDPMGSFPEQCSSCREVLSSVWTINWPLTVAAIAAVFLVLGGGTCGAVLYSQHRQAKLEEELLAKAVTRLQTALTGVTSTEVPAITKRIQRELGLSEVQVQQLVRRSQSQIANLPRGLTPEIQKGLDSVIRSAYSDGLISQPEQDSIDRFVRQQRLASHLAREFQTSLERRMNEALSRIARGHFLLEQRKVEEARNEFAQATQRDPGNAMAWANLAAADLRQGRTEEALLSGQQALQLEPHNWLAHYNLGLAAARRGDHEQAFERFQKTLGALPPAATEERRAVIQELLEEPSLASLRGDRRFRSLIESTRYPALERLDAEDL